MINRGYRRSRQLKHKKIEKHPIFMSYAMAVVSRKSLLSAIACFSSSRLNAMFFLVMVLLLGVCRF
jgi:hypothetical protein